VRRGLGVDWCVRGREKEKRKGEEEEKEASSEQGEMKIERRINILSVSCRAGMEEGRKICTQTH